MSETKLLDGKRILVVDDEPDILAVLRELLSMCEVVTSSTFDDGKEQLESQNFDIAILDIMGVDGYGLLEIAKKRNIPAVMLTAHALTPDNLVRSIEEGAVSYIPKDKITDIADFLVDILRAQATGRDPWESWQERLPSSYFEMRWARLYIDSQFWERIRGSIKARKSESKKADSEK